MQCFNNQLGIHVIEICQGDTYIPIFTKAGFIIASCSIHKQMIGGRMDEIYGKYYSPFKKKGILSFSITQLNLKSMSLSEKSDRELQDHVTLISCRN